MFKKNRECNNNHTVGGAIRCKNGKVCLGINCVGIYGSCAEYIILVQLSLFANENLAP